MSRDGKAARGADAIMLDLRREGTLPVSMLQRLNEIAIRDEITFNTFIAELSRGREYDIDWWVCRPATRNNHVSDLYARLMQLTLIRELLEQARPVIVHVDTPEMAATLRQIQSPHLSVVHDRSAAPQPRLKNIAASLFHCIAAALAARWTRRGAKQPTGAITVINTFVSRESLTEKGFSDRYYPGLLAQLSGPERAQTYYLPIFYRMRDYLCAFRTLRANSANFLFYEDHLGLADYLFAFGHWLRVRRHRGRAARYAGFAVGPLVDADLDNGRFDSIVVRALLAYRFHAAAAQRSFRIRTVLDWYEGLDLNHAIAAGINWHSPQTRLTGFRSAGSLQYMSCTPAPHEVAAGIVPHRIAVVGTGLAAQIASRNPELEVRDAPGMRYRDLSAVTRAQNGERGILLALPLSPRIARAAILLLAEARSHIVGPPLQWWIKSHPALPEAEVLAALGGSLPTGFSFVHGNFHDLLRRAEIVAGLGSSALMESAALGIPTICLAEGNVPTEIPVPAWVDARLSRVTYDARQTADAIREMIGFQYPPDKLAELRDAMLGNVSRDAMRGLLELDA